MQGTNKSIYVKFIIFSKSTMEILILTQIVAQKLLAKGKRNKKNGEVSRIILIKSN